MVREDVWYLILEALYVYINTGKGKRNETVGGQIFIRYRKTTRILFPF